MGDGEDGLTRRHSLPVDSVGLLRGKSGCLPDGLRNMPIHVPALWKRNHGTGVTGPGMKPPNS